jgi:hypothetical protein
VIRTALHLFRSTVLSLDIVRCILLTNCVRRPALNPPVMQSHPADSLERATILSVTGPNIFCKLLFQLQNIYSAMTRERKVLLNIMHYHQKPMETCRRSLLQKESILRQYICCQAIKFHLGSIHYKVRASGTVKGNVNACSYFLQYIGMSPTITIT